MSCTLDREIYHRHRCRWDGKQPWQLGSAVIFRNCSCESDAEHIPQDQWEFPHYPWLRTPSIVQSIATRGSSAVLDLAGKSQMDRLPPVRDEHPLGAIRRNDFDLDVIASALPFKYDGS